MSTASASSSQRPTRPGGAFAWRRGVELLASMRFAIALLTVICIASVIGTVVHQHEPVGNYVNQFGPFWAQLFLHLQLNRVYSAWWFLLILAFLVVSTSLCIARHAPKYLADMRKFKEDVRGQSLRAMPHHAEGVLPQPPEAHARQIGQALVAGGWRVRLQRRCGEGDAAWMVAAKAGSANRLGYIAAHSAIVLICLGGLFDGDLFVRAMTWLGGKTVYGGAGVVSDVGAQHRLSARNPAFRGDLVVPEGTHSSTAILRQSDGVLLQELPFSLELKKFEIDFYPTGMPKLFASDVVLHDLATGEKRQARVMVNHPAEFKGIHIYQSGFEDGGSHIRLRALPLQGAVDAAFDVQGRIGEAVPIAHGGENLTLELTDLRVLNVENLHDATQNGDGRGSLDVRKVDLAESLSRRLGAADKVTARRDLRNIGPSITYKLRDAAGQAREFHSYMRPVDLGGGTPVFLLGVRQSQADAFSYLRVPADENGSLQGFVRLNAALAQPAMRARAVQRYVALVAAEGQPQMRAQLAESATRAISLFAGVERVQGKAVAGLQGISAFIESAVPKAEHERAAEVLMRVVNGVLFQLNELARGDAGLAPLPQDDATQGFMTQAVFALSDVPLYGAAHFYQMEDYRQVQASVFQVTRAPGKSVVYLGCLLLIIGVFAMLYVRERRLWILLEPHAGGGSHALMALSANRKTLDVEREFAALRQKLLPQPQPPQGAASPDLHNPQP